MLQSGTQKYFSFDLMNSKHNDLNKILYLFDVQNVVRIHYIMYFI